MIVQCIASVSSGDPKSRLLCRRHLFAAMSCLFNLGLWARRHREWTSSTEGQSYVGCGRREKGRWGGWRSKGWYVKLG